VNEGLYSSFNCVYFDHALPVFRPYRNKEGEPVYPNSTVFGPTCDSMDVIGHDFTLPEMEIGEKCVVENFGAYTIAATTTFNGFSKPDVYYTYRKRATPA
jgi:ornithine decarboxylase